MHTCFTPSIKLVSCLFLLIGLSMSSQEELDILDAYEDYTEAPREVVYLHLNKSTYIIGETLGFTAYVLDKNQHRPAIMTTNLYVTIEDASQHIIKQKLIEVEKGIASNTFEIDSLFTHGNYQIKAYTNWMNNFNEPNYFMESITIKDQNITALPEDKMNHRIDAQFLPESGHMLNGVENTIGVVIKDHQGNGMPAVNGEVINQNGDIITTFKTNLMGIGRFALVVDNSQSYRVKLEHEDTVFNLNQMVNIHNKGIILSVKRLKNKFFVSAITNASTLNSIKNKRYSLLLHNGHTADLMEIYFTDQPVLTKVIELDSDPGMNILTLFNENNQPIAERLIFNYQGLSSIKSETETLITKSNDSMAINLSFKTIDPKAVHHLSASILPKDTKSYHRAHNIISYNYLQPYVKGYIQNAKYYFTAIDERKKFELDNLLITQGWSSYDWGTIFNDPPELSHNFEKGIIIKANYSSNTLNDNGLPNDLMYHFNNEGFEVAEANTDQKSYVIKQLFPEDDSTIEFSEITDRKTLRPAQLYLQFFPRQIPKLHPNHFDSFNSKIDTVEDVEETNYNGNIVLKPIKGEQRLDEVLVKSNPQLEKRLRRNALSVGRFGRVNVVDENDENTYITLWNYLSFKAWQMLPRHIYGPNGPDPLRTDSIIPANDPSTINFFLDDVLLLDISLLDNILLSEIDYVEVNRFGVGEGMRSPKGAIKIYSKDPSQVVRTSKKTSRTYVFPLTFSKQKTYYAPKYRYYNDDFYKHYGVIDWKPNLNIDSNGLTTIEIAKPKVPVKLFIEGIANDGAFVFEEKIIDLN